MLLALGAYTVYTTLRWMFTGRKTQVVLVWQQFGQLRPGARFDPGHAQSFGHRDARTEGDVVDVEVREVNQPLPRLPDEKR